MRVRTISDGSQLELCQSRPWIQGFFGLPFAAIGVLFLVLCLQGDMETVQAGQRVPVSPTTKAAVVAGSILAVAFGLLIAGYRQGITLDRLSGVAVRWQRLLVPLSARQCDLRRYTGVWLRSEVRESVDPKTDRRRSYVAYRPALTEPRGSELALGETTGAEEARTAGRLIAEFLSTDFLDKTAGEAPPVVQGANLEVGLPGDAGSLYVATPVPDFKETYEFRECLDRPADSQVAVENCADGVTLTVPPAGIWYGSKGLFPFAILWLGLTTAIGAIFITSMYKVGRYDFWPLAGIALFAVIGVLMLAGAVQMGRRRAVLAVVGDRLLVLQSGPLGSKPRDWSQNQLADIRTGPSGMKSGDIPVIELQVVLRDGKHVDLLSGHDEEELRWLATVLKRALKVGDQPQT
jgi:hypothetical protein